MAPPEVMVNGRCLTLDDIPTHTNLLDFLREQGLTGCKEGCAEGECGACSVLVARPRVVSLTEDPLAGSSIGTEDPLAGSSIGTEWVALNACLLPAAALDGQEVVTAEGLGKPNSLHPVQREMAVRGGSQCGYCTPGFIASMAAEYYRSDRRSACGIEHQHRTSACGIEHQHRTSACGIEHQHRTSACGIEHQHHTPTTGSAHEHGPNGFDLHALSGNLCRCTGYRPIRDAAYALGAPDIADPLAARCFEAAPAPAETQLNHQGRSFVRPSTLADALHLLATRPGATVVSGSTDWGVGVNLRGARAEDVVAIDRLPQLRELTIGAERIEIGAALTLTEIERSLAGRVPLLAELFPQFASRLIRNGATLGGNLGTGSPIGDSAPVLLALDATLVLAGKSSERSVALADYFTGYRQSVRLPGELIRAISIPLPLAPLTAFHKIAKRRFDDISSVAVAFAIDVADGIVRGARIGLGGVAAIPIRARATEAALRGRPWTEPTAAAAAAVLRGEGTPMDDHRATAGYRSAMLEQSLLKLYAQHGEVSP